MESSAPSILRPRFDSQAHQFFFNLNSLNYVFVFGVECEKNESKQKEE